MLRTHLAGLILPLCFLAPSCEKPPVEPQPHNTVPAPTTQNVPASAASSPDEGRSPSPLIATDMSEEFLSAFKDSKECSGVQLSTSGKARKPDFRVRMVFDRADTPEKEEEWQWTVFDIRVDVKGDFRGSGNEPSPASAVQGMCKIVWKNFKPNANGR